eukprot:PhF_6_TR16941/c0_g1_i3/m.25525
MSNTVTPDTSALLATFPDATRLMHSIERASGSLAKDFAAISESTAVQLQTMSQVLQRLLELYRDGVQGYLRTANEMADHGNKVMDEVKRLDAYFQEMNDLADRIRKTLAAVEGLEQTIQQLRANTNA